VDVYRTFADGEKTSRSKSRRGSRDRRAPTGLIHAAEADAHSTLCGLEIADLHEFGRSRFPFEHFPQESRCTDCNVAAGHQTW
jgi:hypothetical protein